MRCIKVLLKLELLTSFLSNMKDSLVKNTYTHNLSITLCNFKCRSKVSLRYETSVTLFFRAFTIFDPPF